VPVGGTHLPGYLSGERREASIMAVSLGNFAVEALLVIVFLVGLFWPVHRH